MPALLAHPLTVSSDLGLPPAAVALGATVVVAATVNLVRVRRTPRDAVPGIPEPWPQALPLGVVPVRVVGLLALLGLVYVGRFGPGIEIANLASAVVTGVFWPVLLLASLLGGVLVWRALDPLDTIVRTGERLVGATPARDDATILPVWPAAVAGTAWVVYLHGYARTTPREAAYAVAGYALVLVVGGIALGRRWLASADVFSLLARWCGLRERLADWDAPPGADAVAGALVGGLLYGDLRMSDFWLQLGVPGWLRGPATATTPLAAVLACIAGVTVAVAAGWWARRRGAPGSVAAVLVPLVAALAFSTMLRRLLICLQLVWLEASDPMGRGSDLFGTAGTIVDPNPFGTVAQRWTAVAAVTLCGVLAAYVLARRVPHARAQDPAAITLYVVVALGVLGAATTF